MDSTDESYLLTGFEPKNYDLMETYVESFTESLTQPQFSQQRFLENVDYDDATIGEMLFNRTGRTRCGENRETFYGKWSGAKRWKRTD